MEPPADRDYRAADAMVVLFVAATAWVAIPTLLPKDLPVTAVSALVAVSFLASVAAGARLRDRPLDACLAPGRVDPASLLWILVGTAGLGLLLTHLAEPLLDVLRLLGRDDRSDLARLKERVLAMEPAAAWPLLAGLVPLGEESVFRGALLRGTRASWGTAAALVLSSLVFALFHLLPSRMVVTFVLGLWFGALAVRSGGLAAPVLAHAANNALAYGLVQAGVVQVPAWAAAAGSAAAGIAAWRLFGSRSVQGSGAPGPS